MTHHTGHMSHDEMKNCAKTCFDCESICLETITHCLSKGGKHAEASHIQLLINCAEICQTSAKFLLSGSNLHSEICSVCAIACNACADSCDQFGDDAQMRACAEACRRCAESCGGMSKSARAA